MPLTGSVNWTKIKEKNFFIGLSPQNVNNYANLPQGSSVTFQWVNTFRALRLEPSPGEAFRGSYYY